MDPQPGVSYTGCLPSVLVNGTLGRKMPRPENRNVVRRSMAFPIPSQDLDIFWTFSGPDTQAYWVEAGFLCECPCGQGWGSPALLDAFKNESTWVHNTGRKENPSKPGNPAELWERSASTECLCHVALWIFLRDMVSVASISQICKCANLTAGLTRKQSCELTDLRDVLLYVTSTHKCRSPPAVTLPLTFGMDVTKSIQQNLSINMKYFLGLSQVPMSSIYSSSKTAPSVVQNLIPWVISITQAVAMQNSLTLNFQ